MENGRSKQVGACTLAQRRRLRSYRRAAGEIAFMDKQTFLARLRRERAAWEALLQRIPPAHMALPSGGRWSIKALIDHVTWYEREMVTLLTTRTLAGSPWWELSPAERNARILEHSRERPLPAVLADAQQTYDALKQAIAALDDAAFDDPNYFANMPPDWTPWKIVADSSYMHYRAHMADLQNRVEM